MWFFSCDVSEYCSDLNNYLFLTKINAFRSRILKYDLEKINRLLCIDYTLTPKFLDRIQNKMYWPENKHSTITKQLWETMRAFRITAFALHLVVQLKHAAPPSPLPDRHAGKGPWLLRLLCWWDSMGIWVMAYPERHHGAICFQIHPASGFASKSAAIKSIN